jgi:hypothetical protein
LLCHIVRFRSLNKWFGQLLADPLRNGDELIVPTGSLYIEALPAAHPLLEDFKLRQRELDAIKVMEESRKMKLESIRYAARLLDEEHEDPDKPMTSLSTLTNGSSSTHHEEYHVFPPNQGPK